MAQSSDATDADAPTREIRLVENPDGQWTARDLDVGVSAQGESRTAALDALDAVVAAVRGEGGHEPTDDELRALGIEPEAARSSGELPDVLK
ncbi:HicB family protein (plasmid) [Salinigranum rubrum]|uniref:HicB family protein n=1 Tax=Salinigranum rubrum TaxID=755307 RepID=A0A2I8VRY7_9EURY|nr:HicB family protein [Salinigranum rubrum]AUV84688.1 HicB family protein [Salinigranum rubrum]